LTAPTTRTIHGDCLDVMATMEPDSIDAIVTDPPYGLSFMGKEWDHGVPGVPFWEAALRVLKPGGHLVAFSGSRTYHRLACAVEDAGFEIRDSFIWAYGSGFPKSMNIATAIEKLADPKADPKADEVEFCNWLRSNSTQEVVNATLGSRFWKCEVQIVNAATKDNPVMARRALVPTAAKWRQFKEQYQGSIPDRIEELAKPEPIRAETPGEEWNPGKGNGTKGSGEWAGWGTALKPAFEPAVLARKPLAAKTVAANVLQHGTGGLNIDGCRIEASAGDYDHPGDLTKRRMAVNSFAASQRDDVKVTQAPPNALGRWPANLIHDGSAAVTDLFPLDGNGSAARYFYTAKASRSERGKGNGHPTVKPMALMAYICRLVTPPGGIVLDPFCGSGTTLKAALSEGFSAIGIEKDAAYFEIIENRMDGAQIGFNLNL
jgi:hypothetical protein